MAGQWECLASSSLEEIQLINGFILGLLKVLLKELKVPLWLGALGQH